MTQIRKKTYEMLERLSDEKGIEVQADYRLGVCHNNAWQQCFHEVIYGFEKDMRNML